MAPTNVNHDTADRPRCANWRADGAACPNLGVIDCSNCRLVSYCSDECGVVHKDTHAADCDNPLSRDSWKPGFIRDQRRPRFGIDGVPDGPESRRSPRDEYTWGHTPAMDLLNLDSNEGHDTKRHLTILGVTGDIRNLIITVVNLLSIFTGKLSYTINNEKMDHVARNVFLLLTVLKVRDVESAVDCAIHLWYSAFIRHEHAIILSNDIQTLIEEACEEAEKHMDPETSMYTKTWFIGSCRVNLTLTMAQWFDLLEHFALDPNDEHDTVRRQALERQGVILDSASEDARDRILLRNAPHRRVAIQRFWDQGILAPFGQNVKDFNTPNPLLFRPNEGWIADPFADPSDGWNFSEAFGSAQNVPESDKYGRLYYWLLNLLTNFRARAQEHGIEVSFRHVGQNDLHTHFEPASLSRIDTSNAAEAMGEDGKSVWQNYGPLLESTSENPSATIIAVSLEGVEDRLLFDKDLRPRKFHRVIMSDMLGFPILSKIPPNSTQHAFYADTIPLLLDLDKAFKRYTDKADWDTILACLELVIKEKNTIISKWPTRLTIGSDMNSAQARLWDCISAPFAGNERVIEIMRSGPIKEEPMNDS